MPTQTQSRARRLAEEVASLLGDELGSSTTAIKTHWHPAFAIAEIKAESDQDKTLINVRAVSRRRPLDGRVTGPRTVVLQIGLLRKLPTPATRDEDPINNATAIDAFDVLTEKVFDLFCPVDEELYDNEDEQDFDTRIGDQQIWDYLPAPEGPSQPELLDDEILEEDRVMFTTLLIPYQRME